MKISEKIIFEINLSFLICSLYSLYKNHKVFKKINLKKYIHLYLNTTDPFSLNLEIFAELYELVNKSSLRRFSYILITPILDSNSCSLIKPNKNATKYVSATLLKKYLRKFKYNYHHYFIENNNNLKLVVSNKEINSIAIKYLFILAGI